ncbi:CAMK family protein kinase [Trichomonas vaginalis G3]|uniref:CAMK family protein kinase n=1 Tax=Trichomonas vaginalis (strain ATCC PRA-98 / G3) TaxID=412133 RepID=A2EBR2_TRIV3|nr:protein serine/threonine kinase protein [Trichomonas vaginalis G3]EAY09874.1 CAMK family protein kinase [Trichomonas vaginalis G3]KAI5514676.1 protein serine/threonine kinase protein [Trichomonas vaginalis G3]|eukprot:XP_001322097.1 CAMK family protein kinase [Trichomonas vaginalis G3]
MRKLLFFHNHSLEYDSTIGHGGYGTIYKVYSSKYQTFFALKQIPEEQFNEAEVECLKSIDDPRIVNLYKYYSFNHSIYLLMEYCPSDLYHFIRDKPNLSQSEIIRLIHEAVLCVKSCHDRGISHCDIKPSNFLVDKYGRIKICAFGLSSICSSTELRHDFKGTKVFLSPEIVKRVDYNPFSSDIWSLGVTLFYIATRSLPFANYNSKILSERICNGIYDASRITNPEIRDIVAKCLTINPEMRPSCTDLVNFPFFSNLSNKRMDLRISKSIRSNPVIIRPKIDVRKTIST